MPLLIALPFGLLASFVFLPQVVSVLLGSIIIVLLSKQVSLLRMIGGILLVALAIGYLYLVPEMLLDWSDSQGLNMWSESGRSHYLSIQSSPLRVWYSNIAGVVIYLGSGLLVFYYYWKLRGKWFIATASLFIVSLLLMIAANYV